MKKPKPRLIPVSEVHKYLDIPRWTAFIMACNELAEKLKTGEAK